MRTFIFKFIPGAGANFSKFLSNPEPCVIHKVQMPSVGEPGFYRQTSSFNCFAEGKRKNATKKEIEDNVAGCVWAPTGLYYVHDRHEELWLAKIEREKEFGIDESKLAVVHHKDIYAFYDYIGFDRKKRRYKHW